ncbi:MAG TPA: polymer-forming cytoskeletal protein [Bacteroidia bacterium]|jgi:cytoskeletal protein CcmA (bactofilin family)|nr:polymer-forming cytoskeletal protein [Bacteroidia bacterium]
MAKNVQEDPSLVNQIKAGTHIEGEVKSTGDMRIDGTLKGKIYTQGKLVIGPTGRIDGDISCQNAEIHGTINGKITVNELLSLKASSKLLGDIVIGRLAIEPGAQFSGSCVMGNAVKGLYNGQETKERSERKAETVA